MTKRTFKPSKIHRKRVHGFRRRNSKIAGRKVIKRRRIKGRRRITP